MGKKRRLIKTNSKFGKKYSAHPMFKRLYGENPVPTVESEKVDNAEEEAQINKDKNVETIKKRTKIMSNKREALKAKALEEKKAAEKAALKEEKQTKELTTPKTKKAKAPVKKAKAPVKKVKAPVKKTAPAKAKKTKASAE